MNTFSHDDLFSSIKSALLSCDVSPVAKESAAPLIETWVERYLEEDLTLPTVYIEVPFVLPYQLAEGNFVVIGVADKIGMNPATEGYFGCEWKTTKGPTKWWTEGKWLEEMRKSPQVAILALAMEKGYFLREKGKPLTPLPSVEYNADIDILVRAAVKSSPPSTWPKKSNDGVFSISRNTRTRMSNTLVAKATGLLAMQKYPSSLPYQWTGPHCSSFGRECIFLEGCEKGDHPTVRNPNKIKRKYEPEVTAFLDSWQKEHGRIDLYLSPTRYSTASLCMEKFRQESLGYGGETTKEMQLGTAVHAGVAGMYRYLREIGENK